MTEIFNTFTPLERGAADRVRDDGDHHAGAGHDHRQRRPALYAGLAVDDAGSGQLGVDLLHRRRRDHDLAARLGRHALRPQETVLICTAGFTVASMLCGVSQTIEQMVAFRLLQGVFGAALVPLSQAVMLDIYPPEKRGSAMAIWGMGVMLGPIMGPTLGGWLTDQYSWRWVFFVNLPFGIVTVLGLWRSCAKPRRAFSRSRGSAFSPCRSASARCR